MDDINDYGKFEKFYEPLPRKEERRLWGGEDLKQPEDRPNPFLLDDFSQGPTPP